MTVRIRYRYNDHGAKKATSALRRQIGKETRQAGRDIAQRRCVPPAAAAAPSVYRSAVRPYATMRGVGVRIAGRGQAARVAGYLEFGGTIHAKHGGLLTFQVGGRWVRVPKVSRERSKQGHYIGQVMTSPRMVSAVHKELERELRGVLDRHLSRGGAVMR